MKRIKAYFQGWTRFHIWYKFPKLVKYLIPVHIGEQFNIRVNSMDQECYFSGSCKECGCKTTALQMASIPCEGGCYPKMVNKKDWVKAKEEGHLLGYRIVYDKTINNLKFIKDVTI